MTVSKPRVRFAPSPTGVMHLGNIRIALINYLFAHQKNGIFILRIEDTDPERNVDPNAEQIIKDLMWLGLTYKEGPVKEGPFGPYFQSQRTESYQDALKELQSKDKVYRCFCTTEELDQKRKRQLALKMPPRYDRACLKLSDTNIQQNLEDKKPFIWRLKTTDNRQIIFSDLARGSMSFNLKDFSDIPLTRADGSFTFTFANCVDDISMNITHVIRGEDHISNTIGQIVLYESLDSEIPTFWHVPIMCNINGKKLSKRDFGFSLKDLKEAGFVPEAILNYLGIVGGSFKQEIMSLEELSDAFHFDTLHSTGHIKYDVEKLRWINHKWLSKYDTSKLASACLPFLAQQYPDAKTLSSDTLQSLIKEIQTDLITLQDSVALLKFYFEPPSIDKQQLSSVMDNEKIAAFITIAHKNMSLLKNSTQYIEAMKQDARNLEISTKELFGGLRMILTGSPQGLGMHTLLTILDPQEVKQRIEKTIA